MPGTFPEKSKQGLFYAVLMAHLKKAHGYVAGEDLFVVPFDWRVGVQGLEEVGSRQGAGIGVCMGQVPRARARLGLRLRGASGSACVRAGAARARAAACPRAAARNG